MNNSNNNISNQDVPAFIELKFPAKCKACNQQILSKELAFYQKTNKSCWHTKCGNPLWKVKGTPYYIRKGLAIMYSKKELDFPMKVKSALRRFRKDLTIHISNLKLEPLVFQYLHSKNLIDKNDKLYSYEITPKGFNWNVDKEFVELPKHEEDIMERDAEVDQIVEQLSGEEK